VKSNVNDMRTSLLVRVEQVRENLGVLKLGVSGRSLTAMNWNGFGSANPYVELLKPWNENSLLTVARTETIYGNLNPKFETMTIELSRLRNEEAYSHLNLRCMSQNRSEDPALIGEAQVSVEDILSGGNVDVKLKNRNSPSCVHGWWKQDPGIIKLSDAKILPSVGGMSQEEVYQLLVPSEEPYFENKSELTWLHSDVNYKCNITGEIMEDPIILADGYTYERAAAVKWLNSNSTSPVTKLELTNKNMIPNINLKLMIIERAQALANRNSVSTKK